MCNNRVHRQAVWPIELADIKVPVCRGDNHSKTALLIFLKMYRKSHESDAIFEQTPKNTVWEKHTVYLEGLVVAVALSEFEFKV